MRFAYKRRGGPLLDWSGPTPPSPTRAGETRSLGDFYATTRNSVALRRYGGTRDWPGGPKGYEHNRALGMSEELGAWGSEFGYGGTAYRPRHAMGALDIPRPGAPEIIEGYESPEPGAATIHLGHDCTWEAAHRRAHAMSGYMPEGAARGYGQTMLSADAPAPAPAKFDPGLIRKAAVLASAFHGVRRNHGSVLWGLLWAVAAYLTPLNGLLVPAFGVAQGFGQPKLRSNPSLARGSWPYARTVARKRRVKRRRKLRLRAKKKVARKRRVKTIRGMGPYAMRRPRAYAAARTRR